MDIVYKIDDYQALDQSHHSSIVQKYIAQIQITYTIVIYFAYFV